MFDDYEAVESDGEGVSPTTYVPTVTRDTPSFPPIRFVSSNKKFPMNTEDTKVEVSMSNEEKQAEEAKKLMEKVEMLSMDDTVPDQFDHIVEAVVVATKLLRIVMRTNEINELVDLDAKIARMNQFMAIELGAKKDDGVTNVPLPAEKRTMSIIQAISNGYAASAMVRGKISDIYDRLWKQILQKIKEGEKPAEAPIAKEEKK